MLYIIFPQGMTLEKRLVSIKDTSNQAVTQLEQDYLIDKRDERNNIPLQDIVKEYLRHRTKHANPYKTQGLIIYHKCPAETTQDILYYLPNRNGKLPSDSYKIGPVKTCNKWNPAKETKYGELYHLNCFFSPNRKNYLKQKALERRQNLRKLGDTPSSN